MSGKKWLLLLVLADFAAFTAYVIFKGDVWAGLVGLTENLVALQASIDLVIAMVLIIIWMVADARKRGINPLPWALAACCMGSLVPLAYLLFRPEAKKAPAASAVPALEV